MFRGSSGGRTGGGGSGGVSSDRGRVPRSRSCGPPGGSSKQRQRSSSAPSGSRLHLCTHFRRGYCRFGSACRLSHDPADHAAAALPFHDRQLAQSQVCWANVASAGSACHFASVYIPTCRLQSCAPWSPFAVQANLSTAAAAASAGLPAGAPWRFRVLSYNILADHLAHEHAAELYSSAPRFSLRWSYRSGLIIRWGGGQRSLPGSCLAPHVCAWSGRGSGCCSFPGRISC